MVITYIEIRHSFTVTPEGIIEERVITIIEEIR